MAFPEDGLSPSTSAPAPASSANGSLLFTPLKLRGLTLKNRVIKAAAFEVLISNILWPAVGGFFVKL